MNTRPKAYSYIRFSTPEQEKGDSLRRQTLAASQYAQRHGLELVDASYQDLGVSAFRGANADTGKLAEFMEAVRGEVIPRGSYLLIESMDRLSRAKPRKAIRLLESICEEGITVVTLADGRVYNEDSLDDDPLALMGAYFVAIRANEESMMKSARLKASWEHKRAKALDKPLTSLVPGWMKLNRNKNKLEIIEERAGVIRRVFQMYLEGAGVHRIAETLNSEHVPCFGRAQFWHRSYIQKALENPAVVGTLTLRRLETDAGGRKIRRQIGTQEGYYPAIVDTETFQAAQAMKQGKKAPSTKDKRGLQNILGGLAVCPKCDSAMTRVNKGDPKKGGRPKLVCTKAKAGAGCEYVSTDLEGLEALLVAQKDRLIGEAPVLGEDLTGRIANLEATLDDLVDQAQGLAEELIRTPSEALRAKLLETESQIRSGQKELQELLNTQEATSPTLMKARLKTLNDNLEIFDRARANAALRSLVSKVIVREAEGLLEFYWLNGRVTELGHKGMFDKTEGTFDFTKLEEPEGD